MSRNFSQMLSEVKMVVMDEADRLLELGFRNDIEEMLDAVPPAEFVQPFSNQSLKKKNVVLITSPCSKRQTMMVSATFPKDVRQLVRDNMKADATVLDLGSENESATPIQLKQSVVVCPTTDSAALLLAHLRAELQVPGAKVICFFNTVRMTQYMSELFGHLLNTPVLTMHSKLSGDQRERSWKRFQKSAKGVLFTSDVSARGMDYDDVTLVVQFGVASSRQQFIHRLGRTARAGKEGKALLLISRDERAFLKQLQVGLVIGFFALLRLPLNAFILQCGRNALIIVISSNSFPMQDMDIATAEPISAHDVEQYKKEVMQAAAELQERIAPGTDIADQSIPQAFQATLGVCGQSDFLLVILNAFRPAIYGVLR